MDANGAVMFPETTEAEYPNYPDRELDCVSQSSITVTGTDSTGLAFPCNLYETGNGKLSVTSKTGNALFGWSFIINGTVYASTNGSCAAVRSAELTCNGRLFADAPEGTGISIPDDGYISGSNSYYSEVMSIAGSVFASGKDFGVSSNGNVSIGDNAYLKATATGTDGKGLSARVLDIGSKGMVTASGNVGIKALAPICAARCLHMAARLQLNAYPAAVSPAEQHMSILHQQAAMGLKADQYPSRAGS